MSAKRLLRVRRSKGMGGSGAAIMCERGPGDGLMSMRLGALSPPDGCMAGRFQKGIRRVGGCMRTGSGQEAA